ncbi:MAG: glycosyltransferase family 4 protein [Patescibacteria group bacterium]
MKVLFISSLYYPHVGGIETMITELADNYRKKGIESVVLTKKWPLNLPDAEEYKWVKIYRVISARTKDQFEGIIDWIKANNSNIKSDIIHVIGIRRPLPLIGLFLSKLWKVPIICTIGGGDIPDKIDSYPTKVWEDGIGIIPHVLEQSDIVNCVSQALVSDLEIVMPSLSGVDALYAGTDLSIIYSVRTEKIKNQYIFSLRRLDPSKGINILIKAFNLIKNTFPKLHLVIAGEGTEEKKLKKLVSDYLLNDRVIFLGTISFKRGISLLKGAELTVVPSLSEGGGLVNLEAQAAGCPIIASRVGGIPEYLKEGKSGLLFEPGNFRELADKISLLLLDRKLKNKLINGGLKHVLLFDWNVLVPKYISLYRRSIKNYRRNNGFKPWSDLTKYLWNKLNN